MIIEHANPWELWATYQLGASFRFRCPVCHKIHIVKEGRISNATLVCERSRRESLLNRPGQAIVDIDENFLRFKLPRFYILPSIFSYCQPQLPYLDSNNPQAASFAKLYGRLSSAYWNYNLYTQDFDIPMALLCNDTIAIRSFILEVGIIRNPEYQKYLDDCRKFVSQFYDLFLGHTELFNPYTPRSDIRRLIAIDRYDCLFGFPIVPAPILMCSVRLERPMDDAPVQPDLSDPITKYLFDFLADVYDTVDIDAVLECYRQIMFPSFQAEPIL